MSNSNVFPNLVSVTPRGDPFMGTRPPYVAPFGNSWSLSSNLRELQVAPVGKGDGGGNPADKMTKEYTDAEAYITWHYPLTMLVDNAHRLLHKGFLCFFLKEMPGASEAGGQGTYTVLPLFWLNQFLEEMHLAAKEKLRSFMLNLFTQKYPFLLPRLNKLVAIAEGESVDRDEDRYGGGDGSYGSLLWQIDECWLEFMHHYMPGEDFLFREVNYRTYGTSNRINPVLMPNEKGDSAYLDIEVLDYRDYRRRGVSVRSEKARYGGALEGILNDSKSSSPSSFGNVSGSAKALGFFSDSKPENVVIRELRSESQKRRRQEFERQVNKKTKHMDSIGNRSRSSFSSSSFGGKGSKDPLSSLSSLLEQGSQIKKATDDAVSEIREYLRSAISEPASNILGDNPNPLSFLYRGGFHNNFTFMGSVDTLADDTTDMHAWNRMIMKDQIAKVGLEREQLIYNIWGGDLPQFTKLYLVVLRKRNAEYFLKSNNNNNNNVDYRRYLDNGGVPRRSVSRTENERSWEMDLSSINDGYSERKNSHWSGWFDYGSYQVVPMQWGLGEINDNDLIYSDIHGRRATATPIYVGIMKYPFRDESYPWLDRDIALGKPNTIDGLLPGMDQCKRAMGKLPKIQVLLKI